MESVKFTSLPESLSPLLITVEEVAKMTRLGKRTIWRQVSQNSFPAPIYIGRSARWRVSEIKAFFDEIVLPGQNNYADRAGIMKRFC